MDLIELEGHNTDDSSAANFLDFIMVPVHLHHYGAVLFGINTTIKYLVILVQAG